MQKGREAIDVVGDGCQMREDEKTQSKDFLLPVPPPADGQVCI